MTMYYVFMKAISHIVEEMKIQFFIVASSWCEKVFRLQGEAKK